MTLDSGREQEKSNAQVWGRNYNRNHLTLSAVEITLSAATSSKRRH